MHARARARTHTHKCAVRIQHARTAAFEVLNQTKNTKKYAHPNTGGHVGHKTIITCWCIPGKNGVYKPEHGKKLRTAMIEVINGMAIDTIP